MLLTRAQPEHVDGDAAERDESGRAAALVFAAAIVMAVPVILYQNRSQWFFRDEWDFLADRDIRSAHELLRPHNEHWTTIPIALYRVLFRIVGLHHYWPYQLLVVTAHLSAAVLLHVVMRRAGVNAWLATAAASLFAYFGTGRANIGWAFQVTFSGSLAFGLAAIVLADHRDRFGRRDVLAISCGLGALMCSGIGVPMVVALGVAILVARGWRAAAASTAPLAAIYLAWYLAYGRDGVGKVHGTAGSGTDLAWHIVRDTFVGLGQLPGVGLLLAIVLVVGLLLALHRRSLVELRSRYSSTVGLLAGAVAFLAITGYGRSAFSTQAASRYEHLLAAMVLPAVALAASAIATRWRYALPGLLALLLVGLPGNVDALRPRTNLGQPDTVLTVASLAPTLRLPRSFHPLPQVASAVTMGWLLDQKTLGRIPDPPHVPQLRANLRLMLALHPVDRPPDTPCKLQADPAAPLPLALGDELTVTALSPVTLRSPDGPGAEGQVSIPPKLAVVHVRVAVDRLTVRVTGPSGAVGVSVCRPPG